MMLPYLINLPGTSSRLEDASKLGVVWLGPALKWINSVKKKPKTSSAVYRKLVGSSADRSVQIWGGSEQFTWTPFKK